MINVGDEVSFNGVDYFKVTHIVEEEVKTRTRGKILFRKLYFGLFHPPMFEHSVSNKRDDIFHEGSAVRS